MSLDPNEPKELTLMAAEEIKTKDVPPGSHKVKEPKEAPKPERPPLTEEQKKNFMDEYTRLMALYVEPHNVVSSRVTKEDVKRVIEDGKDMLALCTLPRGLYPNAQAIAHPQINAKDPLRFFVLPNGLIVINPAIINHTKVPVFKEEGCMSYPDKPPKTMVQRYHKITIRYQSLVKKGDKDPELGEFITEELTANPSHVFQHKCMHLNGHGVYEENFDPKWSVGVGDGVLIPAQEWDERKK